MKMRLAAAGKIKKSEVANEAMIREANFTEGKSYYQLNNFEKAMPGLKTVATDVKYEQGAESKYLVAEIYYQQKNLQKSEDEIVFSLFYFEKILLINTGWGNRFYCWPIFTSAKTTSFRQNTH